MPLVEIRKTLIGHWSSNTVMQGFDITRVRLILNYRSNDNPTYKEDIIVDVEHRTRVSDRQVKAVVIGSMLGSVFPQ